LAGENTGKPAPCHLTGLRGLHAAQTGNDKMDNGYGFLGYHGTGLFMMLLIGVIAGYLAEKVTSSDHGILTNILVGIAGAFVGGKLAEVLNVPIFGFVRILMAATVGAIVLIYFWRALGARGAEHKH